MKAKVVAFLSLALSLAGVGFADTLLLDGIQIDSQSAHERPSRGMTMTSVETQFGSPVTKYDAVGDPPISRWVYPGFVVFFEYDRVLHAVVPHADQDS